MKKKILIFLPLVVILIAAGALTWLYTGSLNNSKIKVFAQVPLPAAIIGNKLLYAQDLVDRIELADKFPAAKNQDPNSVHSQLYDHLVDAKKLETIATQKHVSVTSDQIDSEYNDVVSQYTNGDEKGFEDDLKNQFGLSVRQFKDDILRQDVLQMNLAVWFNSQESLNTDAYKLAKSLKAKLDSGESFDSVAKTYTQDEATKDFAGDSGFIAYSDLLSEFQTALKDAKPNDVKLMASRSGLHIIKVLEQDNNGDNGTERIHIQQIFVAANDFNQWFSNEKSGIKVTKLLKV